MITRYTVSFEDRMIEPSPHGKWVKYEDHAEVEAGVESRAAQLSAETIEGFRSSAQDKDKLIEELTQTNEALGADRDGSGARIERQAILLKSAKERLALLGHSPTCGTRYGRRSEDGQNVLGECNCGLHEWMREHELG